MDILEKSDNLCYTIDVKKRRMNMERVLKERYVSAIENMADAKRKGDMETFYFYSGVVSGMRTGVFLSTNMPLEEYKELIKMEDKADEYIRRGYKV